MVYGTIFQFSIREFAYCKTKLNQIVERLSAISFRMTQDRFQQPEALIRILYLTKEIVSPSASVKFKGLRYDFTTTFTIEVIRF